MRDVLFAISAGAALALATGAAGAAPPAHIAEALGNPARPQADRDRDGGRKSAEVVAFSGLKPGQAAADVFPGSGYYTRIFALVVGPKGHVYSVGTTE